jgi:undecaprenyl-diphosphatase
VLAVLSWADARLDRLRLGYPFVLVSVVGLAVFTWMCDAVGDHNGVTAVDGPVAQWFASHRGSTEGQLGLFLAAATSPAVLIALVVLAGVVLRRLGRRLESTLLVGATALAYLAGAVAKVGEHRPRPVAPVNLAPEAEPSFPSGHVLVVATVASVAVAMIWRHVARLGRSASIVLAGSAVGVVSLDRLLVGAHWLTDVVGSMAMAAVIFGLVAAAYAVLLPEPARAR